ncbi:hypothetical protein QBC42DRAFT_323156, partial [Cladorrhinum samala]
GKKRRKYYLTVGRVQEGWEGNHGLFVLDCLGGAEQEFEKAYLSCLWSLDSVPDGRQTVQQLGYKDEIRRAEVSHVGGISIRKGSARQKFGGGQVANKILINSASNPLRPQRFRIRPATDSDVMQIIDIAVFTSLWKGLCLNPRRLTNRLDLLFRFFSKVITSSRNRQIIVAEKEGSKDSDGIIGFAQWRVPGSGGCIDDVWERFMEILVDGNEGGSGIPPAEVTKALEDSEIDEPVYKELANILQENEMVWAPENERSRALFLDFVAVHPAYRHRGVGSKLVGWVYLKCVALDKKWVFTQAVGTSVGDMQSYRNWMFERSRSGDSLTATTSVVQLYILPLKRRMDGSNQIDYDLAVRLYGEQNVDIDKWKWDHVKKDEAKE